MDNLNKLGLLYGGCTFFVTILYTLIQYYSKRGYILGVRLSRKMALSEKVKVLLRKYKLMTLGLGSLSSLAIYFLSFILGEVSLSLAFTVLILVSGLIPLVIFNKKLRILSKEDETLPKVRLVATGLNQDRFLYKKNTYLAYGLILVLILGLGIKIHLAYPSYPQKLAWHSDFSGNITSFTSKSYIKVQSVSILSLIFLVFTMATNYALTNTKLRISPDDPDRSLGNAIKMRRLWTYYCLGLSLLMTLLFQIGLSGFMKRANTRWLIILTIVLIIYALGFPLYIGIRYSIDGSRLATYDNLGYEEDDKYRILGGSIYYNPDDPSFFVEKRIGIGTTINLGTWQGKLIGVLIILSLLGLILAHI
ncbi:MAG: DUF5808 domain-containing protein [Anaerococcus sp.]|nr:DUF5808 domain-containing protein [Anaerococcus sp.]